MDNQSFYERHVDLFNILSYFGIGLLIVGALVVLYMAASSVAAPTTYYDEVSEIEIDSANTGSATEDTLTIVGIEHIGDAGINANINAKSILLLRQFVTIAYPDAESMSVSKKSIKSEGNKYSYEIVTSTKIKLKVLVTDLQNGNFELKVSDSRNEILNYVSTNYNSGAKNPLTLGKSLPKTFNDHEPAFSVTQDREGNYQINVNSCGDADIKNSAQLKVNEWLVTLGYEPSDFNFAIPTLCDRSS